MVLANRVQPDGRLAAVASRGMFTGNRGIIHDPDTCGANGKRWTTQSWICCELHYKDRRREVWGRNFRRRDGTMGVGWSELFFLDEVTALAAGHRPCHTCRREAALAFRGAFNLANGTGTSREIDRLLHSQRRLSAQTPPQLLSAIDLPGLPDGSIVRAGNDFFAMRGRRALPWSFDGYLAPVGLGELARQPMQLVTPKSIIAVLRAGHLPAWHSTAGT